MFYTTMDPITASMGWMRRYESQYSGYIHLCGCTKAVIIQEIWLHVHEDTDD